jgi:hypothetical protein
MTIDDFPAAPLRATIRYRITGPRPAYGAAVNAIVAACDLGIEGAYVRVAEIATVTIKPDATLAQIARQPEAIARAYTLYGWRDVKVEAANV